MNLKRAVFTMFLSAMLVCGTGQLVYAQENEAKNAGMTFEISEYQSMQMNGEAEENEKAPDFTSFGGRFAKGDYLKYEQIDFGAGEYETVLLSAVAKKGQTGKQVELRADAPDGTEIGRISLAESASEGAFCDCYAEIEKVTGIHDVYLVFPEETEVNLDFFTFSEYDGEKDTKEEKDARMEWWREARYGQFIHWGAYAQLGGVYNGRSTEYAEWIMSNLNISREVYENVAAAPFNPTKFDAKEIVQLAKDAGQKYIIFTSRHHEGLSMFDTKIRGFKDYSLFSFCNYGNYTGVDPVAELSKECEAAGIKFGVYYTIMDWHDSSQTGLGYQPAMGDKEEFKTRMKGQLRELIDTYHVKVIFFDGEWTNWWTKEDGEELYRYIRTLDPEAIINNRVGKRTKEEGDYGTPEQEIPATGLDYDWESCMTLNNSWGYHKQDTNWKNADTVVDNLVICASKGGNYLLNIGPDEEGEVPEKSAEILRAVGQWIQTYGDSVYGTGVSCYTKLPSGMYATTKEGKVYLHMTSFSKKEEVVLPGLKNEIQEIRQMGTENTLDYELINGKICIDLSGVTEESYDTVIEITVDGFPEEKETAENYAVKAEKVSATNEHSAGYVARKAIDGDDTTRWATKNNTSSAELVLEYGEPIVVNSARILNFHKPQSNNWVKDYSIDYWDGERWVSAIEKTEMGEEETLEFASVTSQKFRLHMANASNPSIYEFQLFYQEDVKVQITEPQILPAVTSRAEGIPICTPQTQITGTCTEGKHVYVQVKGNNYVSEEYPAEVNGNTWKITLDEVVLFGKYELKAKVKDESGAVLATDAISIYFRESENLAAGKKVQVSSAYTELAGFDGTAAVDGYIGTRWSPEDSDTAPWILVDFGKETVFDRIVLSELFDTWNAPNDYRCRKFSIEAYDGVKWENIYEGITIGAEKVIDLQREVSTSKVRLNILKNRQLQNGTEVPTNIVEFEIYHTGKNGEPKVIRISGTNRFDTSEQIADLYKEKLGLGKDEQFETAVIATGTNFADALAGSYLAYVKNAPILLVNDKKPETISRLQAYLQKNVKEGTIYVLGGTGAVSENAISIQGYQTIRLEGSTRYETNLAILREAIGTKNEMKDLIVATGKTFADSLSASAVKKPILLVKPGEKLSDAQKTFLKTVDVDRIWIIGGTGAVSEKIEKELSAYGTIQRISGSDRCDTSVKVAEQFFGKTEQMIMANAKNFPDGLCGGPLAAALDQPLILVTDTNTTYAAAYVKEQGIRSGYVLGGTGALAKDTVTAVFGAKVQGE